MSQAARRTGIISVSTGLAIRNGDVRGHMNTDKFLQIRDDITRFGSMMSFHQVNDGNLYRPGQRYFKYDLGRVISDKRPPKGFIDFEHATYRNAGSTYLLRVAKENYPLNGKYTINTPCVIANFEADQNGDTVDYRDPPKT